MIILTIIAIPVRKDTHIEINIDKCLACYEYFPEGDKCSTLKDVETLQCNKCNWTFFVQTCFANHLDIRGKKGPSVCNTVFKCLKCNRLFNRKDIAPEDHVCRTTKCSNCKQWVFMSEHMEPVLYGTEAL